MPLSNDPGKSGPTRTLRDLSYSHHRGRAPPKKPGNTPNDQRPRSPTTRRNPPPKPLGRQSSRPSRPGVTCYLSRSRRASVLLFLSHQDGGRCGEPRPPRLTPGAPHYWLAPGAQLADWAAQKALLLGRPDSL